MVTKEDLIRAATSTPPVTVTTMTLLGYGLSDWVMLLTITWVVMQMAHFTVQRYKEYARVRNRAKARRATRKSSGSSVGSP